MANFDSKLYTTKLFGGKLFNEIEQNAGAMSASLFGSSSITADLDGFYVDNVVGGDFSSKARIRDDEEVIMLVIAAFTKMAA